jgi:hypothetical protein
MNGVSVPKLVGDFCGPTCGGELAEFGSFHPHRWLQSENQPEMGQIRQAVFVPKLVGEN